jgi:hypothetical protein
VGGFGAAGEAVMFEIVTGEAVVSEAVTGEAVMVWL